MTFWKVKIRPADKQFSLYIREKAGWKCVVCGKKHDKSSHNFGVSHYHGRRKESVRFDVDNVDAMCNMPCHSTWEHKKQDTPKYKGRYTRYMIKKLGQAGFDALKIRANRIGKKDDKLMIIAIKFLMTGLKEKQVKYETPNYSEIADD